MRALRMAAEPCPPSLSAPLCEALGQGRWSEFWAVPLSFRAAELILQIGRPAVASARILRVGEVPGLVNTSVIGIDGEPLPLVRPLAPSTNAVFAGAVSMVYGADLATASLPPGMYHLTDTSISESDAAEMPNALNEPADLLAEEKTEPDAIGSVRRCSHPEAVRWLGRDKGGLVHPRGRSQSRCSSIPRLMLLFRPGQKNQRGWLAVMIRSIPQDSRKTARQVTCSYDQARQPARYR